MAGPLNLSDPDIDAKDLFASPSSARKKPVQQKAPTAPSQPLTDSKAESEDAREASLRRELAGIRNINEVIEGVVDSLAQAKGNLDVCSIRTYLAFYAYSSLQTISRTVNNASSLLNIWMRILSQTEHNQRLVLNPSWRGATQDLSDMENERLQRRQEKERRLVEEVQKREAAMRKAAEDVKRRDEIASGRRGRGTTSRGRGTGSTTTGGQSVRGIRRGGGLIPGRGSSGIGRGFSGRSRGPSTLS